MKKKYMEPMMIVEDFTISDAIAAKSCKYTPHTIKLISYMTSFRPACADVNWGDNQESRDYDLFSNLYDGEFNTDGDSKDGYPYFGNQGDKDDMLFTSDFAAVTEGHCYTDPFDPKHAGLVFGQNISGDSCIMDTGSSGDTSLLQNS